MFPSANLSVSSPHTGKLQKYMSETPPRSGAAQPRSGLARRSDRIPIAVPIQAKGTDSQGKPFDEKTRTVVISRFGATILLTRPLASGQELLIRCIGTGQETKGRVTGRLAASAQSFVYAVEFLDREANLWDILFPPATESELAAGRLLLECARCGACEVVYLNLLELEEFHKHQRVARPCQKCNETTPWSKALLGKLLVEPSPVPVEADVIGEPAEVVPQQGERADPRLNLQVRGCIRSSQYGEDVVSTENVSEGGICFSSRNQYAGGAVVGVAVPYLRGGANVFVQARITWSRYRAAGQLTAYGLAYVHARRRARRVKATTSIRIGFIGSGVRSTGSVVDVSMNGVLVRCSEPVEVGTIVRLGFEMGHETVRLAATAKRSISGVGIAFEFTQMSQHDRSLLRRLILRLEKLVL
jgi:hypothetical protein